jgi:uncharacterized protein YkwD
VLVLRKNHISVLFVAVFLVFSAAPSALGSRHSSAQGGLLQAMNAARAAHGLQPLRLDGGLGRAAGAHSAEMIRTNTISHGDFTRRMAGFHLGGFLGENLAWGSGSAGSATSVVRMWLASPTHRANLLRPGFHRVGLGLAHGTFLGVGGATVVTADFGS